MQKDPYKKENNLKERETISEIEMDEISEENEIGEIDKGEKNNEKKKALQAKKLKPRHIFL